MKSWLSLDRPHWHKKGNSGAYNEKGETSCLSYDGVLLYM